MTKTSYHVFDLDKTLDEYGNRNMKGKYKERTCPFCGCTFTPKRNTKYCSPECSQAALKEIKAQWHQKNKRRRNDKKVKDLRHNYRTNRFKNPDNFIRDNFSKKYHKNRIIFLQEKLEELGLYKKQICEESKENEISIRHARRSKPVNINRVKSLANKLLDKELTSLQIYRNAFDCPKYRPKFFEGVPDRLQDKIDELNEDMEILLVQMYKKEIKRLMEVRESARKTPTIFNFYIDYMGAL